MVLIKKELINKNLISGIIVLLIIAYPFFFTFQGIDFSDTGYLLTNFQYIFNDPGTIQNSFIFWLTNVIGGVFLIIFQSLGLFGAKLSAIIFILGIIFISYLILKDLISKTNLLIYLFIALLFIIPGINVINYNLLTAFFYLLSSLFFIKGLKNKKNSMILTASFILGLNVFIRFANILGFVLIFIIFFYGHIKEIKSKNIWTQVLVFTIGWVSSIISVLSIMKIIGHFDLYINSIFSFLGNTTVGGASYGYIELLKLFIKDHIYIIALTTIATFLLVIFPKLYNKINNRLVKILGLIIFIFLFFFIFFSLKIWYRQYFIYMLVGLIYLVFSIYLLNRKIIDPECNLLYSIALLLVIIIPLGSDNGVYNAIYGLWLALPLLFFSGDQFISINNTLDLKYKTKPMKFTYKISQKEILIIKNIFLLFLILFSLVYCYRYTYRDSENRFNLCYGINNSKLNLTYTTKDRATVVDELLVEIDKYTKRGDYLLAYGDIPMIHFLTDTKPYLYNSWPDLYEPPQFQNYLKIAKRVNKELPVIVRAKGSTADFEWPREPLVLNDTKRYTEIRKIMYIFMEENSYNIIWKNNFFEILLPGY